MATDPTSALRAASRRFAVAPAVMGLLLLVFLVGAFLEAIRDSAGNVTDAIARYAPFILPAFFYLWALLATHVMFRRVARGDLFEPAVGRGLRHLGWALVGSGTASAVIVPALMISIRRALPRSTGPRSDEIIQVDAAYLILIVVGMALLLVARLFTVAAQHRARNQALQAELEGFV